MLLYLEQICEATTVFIDQEWGELSVTASVQGNDLFRLHYNIPLHRKGVIILCNVISDEDSHQMTRSISNRVSLIPIR